MAGKIISITHEIRGDEIYVSAQIMNVSDKTEEYRLYLYDGYGRLIDKEPDLSWDNFKAGQIKTISVSSSWHMSDLSTIGGMYTVQLKSKTGFWFGGAVTFEDQRTLTLDGQEIEMPQKIVPVVDPSEPLDPIPDGGDGSWGIPVVTPEAPIAGFPWITSGLILGAVVLGYAYIKTGGIVGRAAVKKLL